MPSWNPRCLLHSILLTSSLAWFLPSAFFGIPPSDLFDKGISSSSMDQWIEEGILHTMKCYTGLASLSTHPPQLGQHATTSLTAWLSSALRSPSISSDRHRCLMYVLLVTMNCKKLIHSSLATVILDIPPGQHPWTERHLIHPPLTTTTFHVPSFE